MPPAIAWFAMRIMNQAMAGGMYLADRKSTRLNSSHSQISYAVFCLKKKKTPRRRHLRAFIDVACALNTTYPLPRPAPRTQQCDGDILSHAPLPIADQAVVTCTKRTC